MSAAPLPPSVTAAAAAGGAIGEISGARRKTLEQEESKGVCFRIQMDGWTVWIRLWVFGIDGGILSMEMCEREMIITN